MSLKVLYFLPESAICEPEPGPRHSQPHRTPPSVLPAGAEGSGTARGGRAASHCSGKGCPSVTVVSSSPGSARQLENHPVLLLELGRGHRAGPWGPQGGQPAAGKAPHLATRVSAPAGRSARSRRFPPGCFSWGPHVSWPPCTAAGWATRSAQRTKRPNRATSRPQPSPTPQSLRVSLCFFPCPFSGGRKAKFKKQTPQTPPKKKKIN